MDDVPSTPASAPGGSTPAAPVVTRPTLGQLLGLAWPIVITRSAQVVIGFADAAMVARLGEKALAATTAGATNAFTLLILPMGTCFIVSSFASQLVGAGDALGARRYGWYGLVVALFAGACCLAALPFTESILGQLNYEPEVRTLMAAYLKWRLLSGGFAIGLEALGNYYGGLGNTRLPMIAQVIAMVLNVAFCWVFIYGNLGVPAYGVAGSGMAASLATGIAFFGLFACFLLGVGESSRTGKKQAMSGAELWRMLKFGIPSGLNWFVEFFAFWFFVNVVIAGLGTTSMAAFMSVLQLNSMSFMPAFGIATAGSIFVGQAIGARKHDDVPRTVGMTTLTAVTWQGLVGLTYLAMPALLLSPFVKEGVTSDAFVQTGIRVLMLSAAWQVFDGCANALAEALRAAGDTAFTFWTRSVIAWGVFVPGAWCSVRYFGWGDLGAVAWLVVYIALLALVLWLRFRTGRWRSIELAPDAPHH